MMHGYWFGPDGWIWMIVNAVFWLAVIGGLIGLVVWAARRPGSGPYRSDAPAEPSAKEVAQMRYARGEITREQYLELLENITR